MDMWHTSGGRTKQRTHVFVGDMLQELKLSVGALTENRGAERLHDLLNGDR